MSVFDVGRARRLAASSREVGKLSRCIEDACDEVVKLHSILRDWRTCPYCVHMVEWQDSDPIEGPCAGCRRAERTEAQRDRLADALREIKRIRMEDPAELVDEIRTLADAALSEIDQAASNDA